MKRLKLFIENFLIYGFGGAIGKIIPVIMVPIITRILPDSSYYGINDMSNTIISIAAALGLAGIYDAMYRMFFEKEDLNFKKAICSTALLITIISSVAVAMLLVLFRKPIAKGLFLNERYTGLVIITAIAALSSATNSIVSAPTRMQNKRWLYLLTNTAGPITSYGIAILLLIRGHYVVALPLAALVSGVMIEAAFIIMNHKWFSGKMIDWKQIKPLLAISLPTIPVFLIYWVFDSSDKLMITRLIGMQSTGIYSVGAKLGHLSHLIYTAFAGGWQYFAFSTMQEKDQVKTNSMVFEYLGIVAFSTTVFICAWSHGIYRLLFEGDYVQGYIVAPYLFLAPLLQMLYQVAANQFLVVKNTVPFTLTLLVGAALNVGLNLFLIPRLGIEGAAIATLVGYVVSVASCIIVLRRMDLFVLSKRFLEMASIMAAFLIIWRLFFSENILGGTVLALAASASFIFIYRADIAALVRLVHQKLVKKA